MSKREKLKIEELDTKKKKKSKSSKRDKEKKDKTIDKPIEDAPKRRRGRPFGSTTKVKEPPKLREAEELSEHAIKILAMLEVDENDPASLTQRDMFERVLKMLPATEKRYYESPTQQNVYAFNALVTQTRELIADFQAKTDNSKVLDNILYGVLQPTILSFIQFLMDSNHNLNKQLKDIVKDSNHKKLKDILDDTTKSMGAYGQEMFATLKERLPTALE